MSRTFGTSSALPNDWPSPVHLASLACQALIAEAELTPKPGLVDRRGSGAHADLSLAILRRSALTIEPSPAELIPANRCENSLHASAALQNVPC
jgi:triphosphoribosyl-dephospho-CoA synthase